MGHYRERQAKIKKRPFPSGLFLGVAEWWTKTLIWKMENFNMVLAPLLLLNQSRPFFLTNHFKFYFLLFLHSILYLILYEIFVKRFDHIWKER